MCTHDDLNVFNISKCLFLLLELAFSYIPLRLNDLFDINIDNLIYAKNCVAIKEKMQKICKDSNPAIIPANQIIDENGKRTYLNNLQSKG